MLGVLTLPTGDGGGSGCCRDSTGCIWSYCVDQGGRGMGEDGPLSDATMQTPLTSNRDQSRESFIELTRRQLLLEVYKSLLTPTGLYTQSRLA